MQLSDAPVLREVVDAAAKSLVALSADGQLTFGPPPPTGPLLSIARSGASLIFFWPASAAGYDLYVSSESRGAAWTKVPVAPVDIGGQKFVSLSLTNAQQFFRLMHPYGVSHRRRRPRPGPADSRNGCMR